MDQMQSTDYMIFKICEDAYREARRTLDSITSSASVLMGFYGAILAICFGTIDYSALNGRNFWSWMEIVGILLMIIGVVMLCRLILRGKKDLHFDLHTLVPYEDTPRQSDLLKKMTQVYTQLERESYTLERMHRADLRTAMVFSAAGLVILLVSCIIYKGRLF